MITFSNHSIIIFSDDLTVEIPMMSGFIEMESENASTDSNSDSESGLRLNLDKEKKNPRISLSEDSHFVRFNFLLLIKVDI